MNPDLTGTVDISEELNLRRKIEEFYLPQQLVNAIVSAGGINENSKVTPVGIGFLDISRYTFLSQFLSPQENQIVLNGLYSAFSWVLFKYGGYLNKIEGDSLMFHFGGPIDPRVKGKNEDEATREIARGLFYSCIELQRVSSLFNENGTDYLEKIEDQEMVDPIYAAYQIMGKLRSGFLSNSFNALFQIRIRVGASFGRVLIGNFGPPGAKQWDVIGMPVIEAKRMEASAPIGGLRITADFYNILESTGLAKEYHGKIQQEAESGDNVYRNIAFGELFRKSIVCLKDKRESQFTTYSIQVSPSLPESIRNQCQLLLRRWEAGADAIVNFIKYYRGNHFVITRIEEMLREEAVLIRKQALYQLLFPLKYKRLLATNGGVPEVSKYLDNKYSLFALLSFLGNLQDAVSVKKIEPSENDGVSEYQGYQGWIAKMQEFVYKEYNLNKDFTHKAFYFYNVVFPLFFANIKASILEYQESVEEVEET